MPRITEEQEEMLIQRLINRIDEMNTLYLEGIGDAVRQLKYLTPTQAHRLIQILKYGGSYEQMISEIAKYTNMNVKDIDRIFASYAKTDQAFYEQFYKYRNIPYVPYEENINLRRHTEALANIVKNELYNFTRNNVIGYAMTGLDGKKRFYGLRETYNRVLDEALLNVGQGKENFDSAMRRIMQELGGSGLRTIEYKDTGRSVRLDSAVRMHLKDRLRELHNEQQMIVGKEFDADGVEISVHSYPAPDHELAQGRQFTIDKKDKDGKVIKKGEFEKLQEKGKAKTYDGIDIDLHLKLKNNETTKGFRPISAMNCYHYIFPIILGITKPEYSLEQLKEINEANEKGFEYNGKHYTKYEGTQMQRNLEVAIRKQKDIQILAKASENRELTIQSQNQITKLTKKYREISSKAGLRTKPRKLRVSGYRRASTK